MELRQLEAFVTVAEERNFTRAAARLHIAQSGLSATVRSLERELRTVLFVRSTRKVELSAAGAALLPEARRTLAAALAASSAVASVEGLHRGTLTLGVMQSSELFDLSGRLARYRSRFPGIRLKLQQAGSAELDRLLQEQLVDIIFSTGSTARPRGVLAIPLVRSPLVAICAPDHPLADRREMELGELARHANAAFPIGWGVRTLADQAMTARGLQPQYDFEVNDTDTLLDLIDAGLGVALVPEALAQRRPTLRRIPVKGRRWLWTVVAETSSPAPPNPAARAFWEMLATSA